MYWTAFVEKGTMYVGERQGAKVRPAPESTRARPQEQPSFLTPSLRAARPLHVLRQARARVPRDGEIPRPRGLGVEAGGRQGAVHALVLVGRLLRPEAVPAVARLQRAGGGRGRPVQCGRGYWERVCPGGWWAVQRGLEQSSRRLELFKIARAAGQGEETGLVVLQTSKCISVGSFGTPYCTL